MRNPNAFPCHPPSKAGPKIAGTMELSTLIVSFADTPTQATLMRVSASFHHITAPFLYRNVTLDRRSSYKFFRGCSDDIDTIERKLGYCQLTKTLTFIDVPSSTFYLYARHLYEGLDGMDVTPFIFPKASKVICSPSMITELADYKDRYNISHPFLEIFPQLIQPRQMCLTYPIFTSMSSEDYMVDRLKKHHGYLRERCADREKELFRDFKDGLIPKQITEVYSIFKRTLYSLTIHQVGSDFKLPTDLPMMKIYFRSCDCGGIGFGDKPEGCYSHTKNPERKEQILALASGMVQDRAMRVIKGLRSFKQRVKLINPVLWKDGKKDRESFEDWLCASDRGWRNENIKLEGWTESEVCACCQTKEGI
ncbi:hypothetical protein I302_105804 [Kwoniella bestiolae CBS 10118]|uniref:F-box domain-containing protein n=1 Tax=Kwoniella bestiolae CBS 10118 TaxID=1296100 RepID=A0A1B9G272_9TREE|nr:hypothetical protein I302_04925 [Kwoniella bestiolae CBS 10118]OCF25115.1 hypothetical protein I302_04925 [Kwoniella bestiolae CBS 10118]